MLSLPGGHSRGLSDCSKSPDFVLPVWGAFAAWFDLISTPEKKIRNDNAASGAQVSRTALRSSPRHRSLAEGSCRSCRHSSVRRVQPSCLCQSCLARLVFLSQHVTGIQMWIPSKLPGAEQTGGSPGGLRWLRGLLAALCACPWGTRGTPRELCWAGWAGAGQGKAAGGWPRGAGASPTPRLCPPACPCLPGDKAGLCSGTFLGAAVDLCCCSGVLAPSSPLPAPGGTNFPQ